MGEMIISAVAIRRAHSLARVFPINLATFLCRGKTFEKVSSPAPLYKTF